MSDRKKPSEKKVKKRSNWTFLQNCQNWTVLQKRDRFAKLSKVDSFAKTGRIAKTEIWGQILTFFGLGKIGGSYKREARAKHFLSLVILQVLEARVFTYTIGGEDWSTLMR